MGFRYTACRLAASYPITGLVKNLPDGTVQMVAQGGKEVIIELIEEIKREFAGYLKDCAIEWRPAGELYSSFSIKH